MKKFLTSLLIGTFLLSGCGTEKPISKPEPEPPKTSVIEKPAHQSVEPVDDLPAKISVLPSVGATRAECEKYYKKTAENGRYNNDEYLIEFLNQKDERAYIFMLQATNGKTYNLDDYMPSDLQISNVEEKVWGDVNLKIIEGKSELLKQVCPESEGDFRVQIGWDKETNAFDSAWFNIDFTHGK